jgi:hypothetical protein
LRDEPTLNQSFSRCFSGIAELVWELAACAAVSIASFREETEMKSAILVIAVAATFASPIARAQNASTGSSTTTGDAAVSPATPHPANASPGGDNRPSPGAGIASGAMNNGTTGDTIGTGHGTPAVPPTGTGAAAAVKN